MYSKFLNKCCSITTIRVRNLSAVASFKAHLTEQLDGINKAGTYKKERIITSKQASFITVKNSDKKILNFCANNYLGLSVSFFYFLPCIKLAALSSCRF